MFLGFLSYMSDLCISLLSAWRLCSNKLMSFSSFACLRCYSALRLFSLGCFLLVCVVCRLIFHLVCAFLITNSFVFSLHFCVTFSSSCNYKNRLILALILTSNTMYFHFCSTVSLTIVIHQIILFFIRWSGSFIEIIFSF